MTEKRRIVEKTSSITGQKSFHVECFSKMYGSWFLCKYRDHDETLHDAIFSTFGFALTFAEEGRVVEEKVVWEGEYNG